MNKADLSLETKCCLSYWFPKIENLGIPVPQTEIINTDLNLIPLLDYETPDGYDEFLILMRDSIQRIGLPAFLRTGHISGKHSWKQTCFIENDGLEHIHSHVFSLVEESALAGFLGLPTNVWVVRQYLPTQPIFKAFWGEMPIVNERRYFVRGDEILCWHPYWPTDAFTDKFSNLSDHEMKLLHQMNVSAEQPIELLDSWTQKVGSVMEGAWSVDYLETDDGWYLIDMAPAELSFHWPECEFANQLLQGLPEEG